MKTKTACLLCAAGAALAALGINFPVGTYVYSGSVLDYRHEVMTSDAGLTIQAVSTNGTVLASSRVIDPVTTHGANFRLEVPISTQASSKSAAIGDELNCVVLSDSGTTNVSLRPLPRVAAANAITNVNVVSAPSTAFTTADGVTVLVADDYLAGIAPWMSMFGKTVYEPSADWDGDGVSNYGEYKAGTNPFDASDRLRITEFKPGGETALLKFEYAGGHLYALDSRPSLTEGAWKGESFRVDSPSAAGQTTFFMPGNEYEDIGETTIYVVPAASEPSMFYTIRAE